VKQTEFWFLTSAYPPLPGRMPDTFSNFLDSLSDFTYMSWTGFIPDFANIVILFSHPSHGKPYFDRLYADCCKMTDPGVDYEICDNNIRALSHRYFNCNICFSCPWADSYSQLNHYVYCAPDLTESNLAYARGRLLDVEYWT